MWVSRFFLGGISKLLVGVLLFMSGCQTTSPDTGTVQEPPSQVQIFPSAPIKEEKLPLQGEEAPVPVSSLSVFKPTQPSFRVAFLVPFSGAQTSVGQALWEGAQIGYFDAKEEGQVDFLPKDTKGTPEGAQEALTTLFQEGEVDFIVGPLLAEEVKAITPLAWQKGVPILSFSNTSSIAGDNVFILGYSPEEQMRVLLQFAASQKLETFVLLVPSSEYGKRIQNSVRQYFNIKPGVTLKEIVVYRENGTDISEKVGALQLTGVDALIIPEGGERLLKILTELNKNSTYKIPKPKLMGSGQWDDPILFSNPLIQGGWFVDTLSLERPAFEKAYQEAHGIVPVRLSSLGYDAAKVAIEIAENGGAVLQTITRPQGFQGAEGLFSFTPRGDVQRKWGVYEINQALDDKVRLLTPAS